MVRKPPADVEALRLLQAGRPGEALPLAEAAVAGARQCLPSHGLLATVLHQLGRDAEANAVIDSARGLGPGPADAYDALAYVSMALGRHERAAELYRMALAIAPREPRHAYNLACCERGLGRLAEAEAACDQAIAADPLHFSSYLLRSELRVQSDQQNHVEALRRLASRLDQDPRAQMFLGYALGKELDDLGAYDEAFAWFDRAARARRSRLSYDVGTDVAKIRRIIEEFPARATAATGPARDAGGTPAAGDVFIVGLPRSGTTLLERILTGLPGVRSNGETDHFSRALLASTAPGAHDGDVFARAAAADPRLVGERYRRLARPGDVAGTVIEKLPLNYLYVGPIRRALPRARIVWVRRAPIDSCFAMYRTLFGTAYPFSYDFTDLALYYAAYQRLMLHWRSFLAGDWQEVVYEELVREPHRVGAAVAAHCGLGWTPAAVDIQNNRGVSLTASAAQVRRPIYGSSSGRWRHYRQALRPLIAALRDAGVETPADA